MTFLTVHIDALQIIKIEEDKLLAQWEKGRRGVMAWINVSQTKKEAAQANKQRRHLQLKEKQESEIAALDQNVALELSDSSSSTHDASDMETEEAVEETIPQCCTSKRKCGKISIMTPALLSSLDRTKTSNRDAAQITAPVVHATGQNVEQYIVNRSSIR